ncbi:MAG: hypothetical protein RLO48_04105, partial [Bauldia litoralis]
NTFRERHGGHIAADIHLAAYYDISAEKNPLYEAVNVEGTRHLVRGLRDLEVDQFIYSETIPSAGGTRDPDYRERTDRTEMALSTLRPVVLITGAAGARARS